MPFGFAEHFPGQSEYITMIRDPIARAISDYFFCLMNPSNPAHQAATNLPLHEFVSKGYGSTQNCYARWLSNAAYGAKFSSQDEMLREAMRNLSQFSFIGITEQFDLSVARLCRKYGLVLRAASEINRNAATPEAKSLSEDEQEVLRTSNALDLVIYEECRRRFAVESAASPGKSST